VIRRGVGVALLVLGGWAALGGLAGAATLARSPAGAVGAAPPCPHGRPIGPHEACIEGTVHHSGGTSVVRIVVSVLVGVGVAAGALVVVRRRITEDAAKPRPAPRPRRPS
jgi:hypothetical protein